MRPARLIAREVSVANTRIPLRVALAASAGGVATALSSYAIGEGRAGAPWVARAGRPRGLGVAALSAQLVMALALAFLASADVAAQWPTRNHDLSSMARGVLIPASLLSAALGILG